MSAERRGNPFGWIFLGFIVGVLATFGTILFLTAGTGGYDQGGPEETRTVADDAASDALNLPASNPAAPRRIEAPVAAAPQAPAHTIGSSSSPAPPRRSVPALDPQMADDAAAAGMTSRGDQPTN